MAYSSVGSFGTVAETPPECPGSLPFNDDGTCPFPSHYFCDEGDGRALRWTFVNDSTGNPTDEVVSNCGCAPGFSTNLNDPQGPCVPRVCGDFDLDNSEPCVDERGTFPDMWFFRSKKRCGTSPHDLMPLHPAGTHFVRVGKRQRARASQRYYAKLNCDGASQGALGTKLMIGGAVVFGGVLVGSLLAR